MSKNKVIAIQYKLIEMSQTRARGACTQMKTHILMETKLHLIAHVSVSKSKDKLWYFDSIFNVKHVRTLHMISVPFTRPSKLFFRGKKSSCQLFVWM